MYSQLTVPHCYRTSQILSLQVYPHLPYLFEKVLPGYSFSPTLLQLPYLSVSVHTSCRAKLTQLHFRETSHSQPVQPDKKISTHIVLMFSRRWPRRRRCVSGNGTREGLAVNVTTGASPQPAFALKRSSSLHPRTCAWSLAATSVARKCTKTLTTPIACLIAKN